MYSNKVTPTTAVSPFTSVPQKPEVFDELFDEYPPVRVRITNKIVEPETAFDGGFYFDVVVPIKYGKLLHPTRTMVQVEYCAMNNSGTSLDPDTAMEIQLPDVKSSFDFKGPGYSSTVWQGTTVKTDKTYYCFPAYSHPVNTNEVGFPIRDPYFLNNKDLLVRFFSAKSNRVYLTNLSLVFYTYTGGK